MKKTIHYALVLDQSGSMMNLKNEVISSFNEQVEMIRKLGKNEPEVEIKITLCVFNDTVDYKYVAQPVEQLKKLIAKDYRPDSFTALYDAIGISFLRINEILQPNDLVFFSIFTDGLENASMEYTSLDIRNKLKQAEIDKWMVRFFCRDEDNVYYRNDLNLSESNLYNISLNESGFSEMNKEINHCMETMITFHTNINSVL